MWGLSINSQISIKGKVEIHGWFSNSMLCPKMVINISDNFSGKLFKNQQFSKVTPSAYDPLAQGEALRNV